MVKVYNRLFQLSFDFASRPPDNGYKQVLSGRAAECAAKEILQENIPGSIVKFGKDLGGLVPDLEIGINGEMIYIEVKLLSGETDLVIRRDQHAKILDNGRFWYAFMVRPYAFFKSRVPTEYVEGLLTQVKLCLVRNVAAAGEIMREHGNELTYKAGEVRGWRAYAWWRISPKIFFELLGDEVEFMFHSTFNRKGG